MIKHTRIQDSAGRWRIEFEPSKAGRHQLQTNDNDNDNDKSPLTLASMDILPANYQRTIEGERIIHPNVLNFIVINSTNENLKVWLRRTLNYLLSTWNSQFHHLGSNGDEIPIQIQHDSLRREIYFTLIETGKMNMLEYFSSRFNKI